MESNSPPLAPSRVRQVRMRNDHELLADLVSRELGATDGIADGGPDWSQRIILGVVEQWAVREAEFYAAESLYGVPPAQRDAKHAAFVKQNIAASRKEIAAAFRTIRRLTEGARG